MIEQRVLTHGYVHGHIHKHKDHTHIHGHIHNHDHEENQEGKITSVDGEAADLSESCKEFAELAYCKDILCDELDDCFFFSCEDSKRTENAHDASLDPGSGDYSAAMTDSCKLESHGQNTALTTSDDDCRQCTDGWYTPCNEENCAYEVPTCSTSSLTPAQKGDTDGICYDPTCINNTRISYDCCDTSEATEPIKTEHTRPMFERLINNVLKNLLAQPESMVKQEEDDDKITHFGDLSFEYDEGGLKRRKIEADDRFHQSCFHTTIPNEQQMNSEMLMSDFDFFIQFDTFQKQQQQKKEELDKQKQETENAQKGYMARDKALGPTDIKPFENTEPNEYKYVPQNTIIQDELNIDENYGLFPMLPSQKNFSCQWDHCFKKVNDSNFMEHVMTKHIQSEFVNPKLTSYHCEWSDCNHIDNDLNAMMNHVQQHTADVDRQQAFSPALTPVSNGKSAAASPFENQQVANSTLKHNQNTNQGGMDNSVNITLVKIVPKRKTAERNQDPTLTCKWEIGIEADGNPIQCNIQHASPGDLQKHMCDEHIGAGKSVYHCKWVGCERHNGKEFTQRQKLLRHIHIHTNYKPCVCDICGLSFAVELMLKQHMRTHLGEKPFQCAQCGKRFATSSSLSIHNRVHTGERPLVCKWPGCNKRFSESSNLTKHMRIHEKTFSCEVCGKEFDKKANYTKHMKLHAEEEENLGGRKLLSKIEV